MSERVTEEQLASLEALSNAGSPPPWQPGRMDMHTYLGSTGELVKYFYRPGDDAGTRTMMRGEKCEEDAALIPAARNALPVLIAEVRTLRRQVDEERERANSARTVLESHMSLCCSLRLAKELAEALGTEDVAEAVKEVRRLKDVEAAVVRFAEAGDALNALPADHDCTQWAAAATKWDEARNEVLRLGKEAHHEHTD